LLLGFSACLARFPARLAQLLGCFACLVRRFGPNSVAAPCAGARPARLFLILRNYSGQFLRSVSCRMQSPQLLPPTRPRRLIARYS
jgi:hypothetical protein